MFSKWSTWKKIVAILAGLLLALLAFVAVLAIDSYAYDNWRSAQELRITYQAWLRDSSPEPPQVQKYLGTSRGSTTYVYTASHVIDGRTYQGLFAYRSYPRPGTFVITRGGEVFVISDSGRVRLLRIHETSAAAW